jgi:hypothetical protein
MFLENALIMELENQLDMYINKEYLGIIIEILSRKEDICAIYNSHLDSDGNGELYIKVQDVKNISYCTNLLKTLLQHYIGEHIYVCDLFPPRIDLGINCGKISIHDIVYNPVDITHFDKFSQEGLQIEFALKYL